MYSQCVMCRADAKGGILSLTRYPTCLQQIYVAFLSKCIASQHSFTFQPFCLPPFFSHSLPSSLPSFLPSYRLACFSYCLAYSLRFPSRLTSHTTRVSNFATRVPRIYWWRRWGLLLGQISLPSPTTTITSLRHLKYYSTNTSYPYLLPDLSSLHLSMPKDVISLSKIPCQLFPSSYSSLPLSFHFRACIFFPCILWCEVRNLFFFFFFFSFAFQSVDLEIIFSPYEAILLMFRAHSVKLSVFGYSLYHHGMVVRYTSHSENIEATCIHNYLFSRIHRQHYAHNPCINLTGEIELITTMTLGWRGCTLISFPRPFVYLEAATWGLKQREEKREGSSGPRHHHLH